ncbi:MAG: lyase family protein [Gemmataceae bacterium]
MNPFDAASPFDSRYYFADEEFFQRLNPYVSELAHLKYMAQVEAAIAITLQEFQVCPAEATAEISRAAESIDPEEVYQEEQRIQHNVRALVNCICRKISPSARPYVHLFATSADVMDTARALALKEVTEKVVIPDLVALMHLLIDLAERTAHIPQMGRTHGQHAVPITFGFALSLYISRVGQRIDVIHKASENLRGKFAGAVGAYNALTLYKPEHPEIIEAYLMRHLGLRPPEISNQVAQPEYITDYIYALASCWGIFANIADDFRNLQRSEIGEILDRKASDPSAATVGSSTMPHKVNPKDFENVKSFWKAYMPRLFTVLMDQITEHQRDLTNSASGRFVTEFVTAFAYGIRRLHQALANVEPNVSRMKELLEQGKDPIAAEPLYIALALAGHPEAHEAARVMARKARASGKPFLQIAQAEPDLQVYLDKITDRQRAVVEDPATYVGASKQRTLDICAQWRQKLSNLTTAEL